MKLGNIIESGDYQKYLNEAVKADNVVLANNRRIHERGSAFIRKFEYKEKTKHVFLIPLEMAIPFNPLNLEDESHNEKNPFILPGSCSVAIRVLKGLANQNEEVKQRLFELLRVSDESVLNLDTESCKDMVEGRIWHKLARISYVVGWTQKLFDGTYSNPIKIGCEPILNEQNEVVGTKGVGYDYWIAESALMATKIKQTTEEYTAQKRSDEDLKNQIEAIRKARIIGNPRSTAFVRFIDVPVRSQDGIVHDDFKELWEKSHNVSAFDRYISYQRKYDDILTPLIGSKVFDNNIDFIELYFTVPEQDKADKNNIYRDTTQASVAGQASIFSPDNRYHEEMEMFAEAVSDYMSDTSKWNNEAFMRSIKELRLKSDVDLASCMKNAIGKYENVINNADIQEQYGEILSSIDSGLVNEAVEKMLSGDVNTTTITDEDIKALPVEGGFNEGNDEEDFSGEFDSLLKED